jgi:hypothetical protein
VSLLPSRLRRPAPPRKKRLPELTTSPDPDWTALPSAGGIADTVAAHLEPVTRFHRADIGQDAPDQPLSAALMVTLVQEVAFDISWHAGPRQLPKDITLLANGTRLKVELSTQLALARDGCDDALRAWVAHDPHAYRRVLPHEAAFRHTPGRYGIEFTCQACYGKCQVQCDGCSGAGRVSCPQCAGAGTVHCHQCAGTTRIKCSGCFGSGHTTEQTSEQRWDPGANAFVTVRVPVNRPCLTCSGSGATHCTACTFGQAQCGACAGKRTVTCKGCAGAGCFDCAACEATGVQHEWAGVTATVGALEELTFGEVAPALQALIRARIDPGALPAYGSHLRSHHVVDKQALGSRYELRIDALYARLQAAARHFSIYALGPRAEVLDFVNIAGHLLEDDLVTLEQAAAPLAPWARPRDGKLLDALQKFIASELNLLIAEQLGAQAGAWQTAAAVEAHFNSMVDAAYVQRASVALRLGFDGLYGADMLRPALWLSGGAAVLATLVYAFGPARYGLWNCTGWAMLAAAPVWAAVEALAFRRIKQHFPAQIGARLHTRIKAGGGVVRWRVAVAGAVLASAFLSVALASKLPLIRHRHEATALAQVQVQDKQPAYSIEQDRTRGDIEGLYDIREQARTFIAAHNKKHKTRFKALDPNLKAHYPRCKTRMTVAWVPKSYGLSGPAVFVICKKSVSEYARKWEAIVPVAKNGN